MLQIEFDGTVIELIEKLEALEAEGKGGYWIEQGPYSVGGKGTDHAYYNVINIDDENDRIFLEDG